MTEGKLNIYEMKASEIVSISHRYGSTTVFTAFHVFIIPYFYRFSIFFSKKVGQPLHSKFLQSLDSTGFFIFVKISSEVHRLFGRFLLFSALFHAVFVLEALILLAWRFTDFFYRFFNNLCFNQRKSSSPLTKTEASFEYLNHTRNPAFAVHPCPSPIFCHQEDKSELRGATPHFLPRLSPKPAQEWLPANFTVHSDFSSTVSAIRLLSPATSVICRFLHRQSRVHYWLYLCHTSCHTDIP